MRLHHNLHLEFLSRARYCDPTGGFATAGVVMALTAVAGGYAAYGAQQQGKANQRMNEYQAATNEAQADLVERNANQNITLTQDMAKNESKSLAAKTMEVQGLQKAALAANGVSGVTAADISNDTISKADLDQQAIRYNADIKSYATKTDATNQSWALKSQAKQFRQAGKNAADAGNIAATSTLLNTATAVAGASQYGRSWKPSDTLKDPTKTP